MANIARDSLNQMDELFRGLVLRPMRFALDVPDQAQMKIDVTRTDDTYKVKAELPGVPRENIGVSIEGNDVTITGETMSEREEKQGEEVIRSERHVGRVSRSFSLPHEIDEEKAKAKYENGVLELTLPKKNRRQGKKLSVG
jgi:HSP20 family protein